MRTGVGRSTLLRVPVVPRSLLAVMFAQLFIAVALSARLRERCTAHENEELGGCLQSAVGTLQNSGLVEVQPGRGARVIIKRPERVCLAPAQG